MKYKVIENVDLAKFEQQVKEALNEGWVCMGGVSMSKPHTLSHTYYAQAMFHQ